MNRAELMPKLKSLMAETLHLEDFDVDGLTDEESLFGGRLDLDSIEALELILRLEKEFGIKIATSEESKRVLATLGTLADAIIEKTG